MKVKYVKIFCLLIIFVLILSSCAGNKQGKPEASALPQSTDNNTENQPTTEPVKQNEIIKKIQVVSDQHGIYSTSLTLSDKITDKGVAEIEYGGQKGTPQENLTVNVFRIEYYINSDGTYEINTFSDGEVYQNFHKQKEVKIVYTFGATLRAGSIKISYTPDGGIEEVIYVANAEDFM